MATVNIFDMVDTWANGATTFTAIKMNVTDTNSASGSLLMDLQVGGSSKFKVSKTSQLLLGGAAGDTAFTDGVYAPNWLSLGGTSNATQVQMRSGIFVFRSDVIVSWSNDTSFGSQDLLLTRKAAASLRLGAADAASPVAQTLGVQSVVAGTTNTAGANFTIAGSQGTGSGAGGSIIFQVAPAGSSGTAQNALATALTITSGQRVQAASWIDAVNGLVVGSGTADVVIGQAGSYGVTLRNTAPLAWTSADATSSQDVLLRRDAANTLALRNSTNAQAFRVYNTYTDASNYERGFVKWDTNVLKIGTEKLGTGTARALEFQTDGTTRVTINSTGFVTFASNLLAIGQIQTNTYFQAAAAALNGNGGLYLGTASSTRAELQATGVGIMALGRWGTGDVQFQFGGTTSSFPALKRSSTTLQVRLADDSGYTNIQGKLTTETAYTAGAPTATGYIVLYDSTGTAYKIPAEAL